MCSSPKRRFKSYQGGGRNDPKAMAARMKGLKGAGAASVASSGGDSNLPVAILAGGAVLLAALYFGLSAAYN